MRSLISLPFCFLAALAASAHAQQPAAAAAGKYEILTRSITGGRYAIPADARARVFLDAGESPRAAAAARAALTRAGFGFVERRADALFVLSTRGAIGFAHERRFYYIPVETYFTAAGDALVAKAGDAPRTALTGGPGDITYVGVTLAANVLLNIAQLASATNANPGADFDQQQAYRHAGGIGPGAVVHLNLRAVNEAERKLPTGFVRGQAIADGASWDSVDGSIDFNTLLVRAADVAAQTLAQAGM